MVTCIIIADDHQILRQGLKILLEKKPDLEVVAEAGDGRRTLTKVRDLRSDVVVMDVKMAGMNGIEATRQILSECPAVKVIALSVYADHRFVTNMLKAGAHAYLLKEGAFEELVQAIRLVMNNKTYLSPGVTEIVVKDYLDSSPDLDQTAFSMLTARERELLQLLAEGKRTSEIAELLKIGIKTVETHRWQIMNKLGIRNLAEFTKYDIREGLTSLEV